MAKVGYARVSSVGQSLDVQREKLGDCDKLFEEKRSGTTDARPQLKQCLDYVRDGDQLIVTRIDRLARSTLHLCQIAETLSEKGVDLVVLDQNIDTSDATGRLLFNMLGAIGQFETEIRAERQMDGIKKAKDRGVQFGKRPALNDDQIADLREKRKQGALIRELMTEYRLSKATIYRYLAENGA
ncbi:DNA invertase Pin-like site-specific DNA recombinase [Gemmobacter caeni]|jgi:DNA invertase Pin-like site-specific DNA recombinase|uniref:DNA invertase Pin-like site-specific DNA recombinase n=1 Tax=Gemmobacter caeni TaxID=589035 RepID=A0A2T6AJ75_9RHOB|nr:MULTISPECIES: recombinase family protein [Paracoccaceae]PTX43878.1 DNA invertase Pin-like site-specific DNA recombinase [Gemmobacter caeni]TWI93507.1 DNA invertase Pin-like site-specific DNA recombinase [Gemmobacter caeni]